MLVYTFVNVPLFQSLTNDISKRINSDTKTVVLIEIVIWHETRRTYQTNCSKTLKTILKNRNFQIIIKSDTRFRTFCLPAGWIQFTLLVQFTRLFHFGEKFTLYRLEIIRVMFVLSYYYYITYYYYTYCTWIRIIQTDFQNILYTYTNYIGTRPINERAWRVFLIDVTYSAKTRVLMIQQHFWSHIRIWVTMGYSMYIYIYKSSITRYVTLRAI